MTTRIIANGTSTEVRRNDVLNPVPVGTGRWTAGNSSVSNSGSAVRGTRIAAAVMAVRAEADLHPSTQYTVQGTLLSSMDVTVQIQLRPDGATSDGATTLGTVALTANVETQFVLTGATTDAPPAAAPTVTVFVPGGPAGDWVQVSKLCCSTTEGPYFDGSTSPDPDLTPSWTGAANASPSILTGHDSTQPILVTGYEATRAGRSTVHDLIGGGIAVALVNPRPRAGTLELLYADEDEAFHALNMHALETTFTMFDTDRAGVAMTYTAGTATITLDDTTRRMWLVKVDFQEVQQ